MQCTSVTRSNIYCVEAGNNFSLFSLFCCLHRPFMRSAF